MLDQNKWHIDWVKITHRVSSQRNNSLISVLLKANHNVCCCSFTLGLIFVMTQGWSKAVKWTQSRGWGMDACQWLTTVHANTWACIWLWRWFAWLVLRMNNRTKQLTVWVDATVALLDVFSAPCYLLPTFCVRLNKSQRAPSVQHDRGGLLSVMWFSERKGKWMVVSFVETCGLRYTAASSGK